ncbi:hypothetical protein [Burkholderia cenocepacia]|uniref:hypothetical protein n=1 Tax=Burkholderia cenocepacia TaxID=95486 RepID=UPI000762142D|nr:hypothetical protein [Burkholderia cenocepacia]KWU26418.1 hypothetical protein AS149_25865 [Burkholderia cenocepacia]
MNIRPLGHYRIFSTCIFAEGDEVACTAVIVDNFVVAPTGDPLKDSARIKALARHWRGKLETDYRHAESYGRFQTFIVAQGQKVPVDHVCAEVNGVIVQLHFTSSAAYVHVNNKRTSVGSTYRALRLFASAIRKAALGRYQVRTREPEAAPNQVGFLLRVSEEPDARLTRVDADLLVDGRPALKRPAYLFDLAMVLAYGARTVEQVYPFTCGCGAPGCAGIHWPGAFTVTERDMVWTLPEEPFRGDLREDLVKEGAPLELRFGKRQYAAALEEVTRELSAIGRRHRFPVVVSPTGDLGGYVETLPVRHQILEDRERLLDWDARMAWREHVWGELLETELHLEMANGYVFSIPLENLGHALTNEQGLNRNQAARDIEARIAPAFRKGLDTVTSLCKALSWPCLHEELFRSDRCPEGVEDAYSKKVEWPEARFTLEKTRW